MGIFEAEMVRRFVIAVEKIANALDRKTENSSEKPNNCEDEPQTQLTAKCLECNNSKACKENHWEGCRYEPLENEVTAVIGTFTDEPQTEQNDYHRSRKVCTLELFDDDGVYIEPQTDCSWK